MSRYDDIIDHPHYRSKTRPGMSMDSRAAQFSPFAALTGLDDAVSETARLAYEEFIKRDTGSGEYDTEFPGTDDPCDNPCDDPC